MAFFQYLKDTRGELNHVAWPTRTQTVIFTILVILISIFVSLYLGFFDFVLTNALGKLVERFPGSSNIPFEIQDIQTESVPSETPESTIDINNVLPDAE